MRPSSLAAKLATLAAVVLLLLLALMSIGGLVDERTQRAAEVRLDIEASQADRQAVLGPVLRTACREDWTATETREGREVRVAQRRDLQVDSAPDLLEAQGRVAMEPRYRGLFKANTYAVDARLTARWTLPDVPAPEHPGGRVTCAAPVLAVAVTDARGLRDVSVAVDGQALDVAPGTPFDALPRGFQAALPDTARGRTVAAEVALQLVGTTDLAFAPVGTRTRVTLAAPWPHPSFGGRFLPTKREVTDQGFEADWQLSSLATTAPRDFLGGAKLCEGVPATDSGCVETFGVAFVDPVNPHALTDRALKYGLLFIALSFVAVGMVELQRGVRVHPVQYLLVGCALALFFLLLLSLSEHFPFGASYAAASAACATLLGWYARHVLSGWRPGLAFGAGIAALYGVLYVLLQREQTALVLGAGLLFLVLVAVMAVTRRVDWYGLSRSTPATS